jgi:hypothetical protein
VDTDFFISGRMYRIAPSSLHGLGLFSMDGIKVGYGTVTELMEYVRPLYKYNHWLMLVDIHEVCGDTELPQIIYN